MFNDISAKIKASAQVLIWLGILASFVWGTVILSSTESYTGVVVMVVGSISSWILSFCMYGLGQLVENTEILINKNCEEKTDSPMSDNCEAVEKQKHLRHKKTPTNTRFVGVFSLCKKITLSHPLYNILNRRTGRLIYLQAHARRTLTTIYIPMVLFLFNRKFFFVLNDIQRHCLLQYFPYYSTMP